MSEIILKPRDLELKTIESGRYEGQRIVQLKPSTAFDESFIAECIALGVKERVIEAVEEEE